jgi:DNA-binding CsgD family transcriptional regulator
MARTGGATESNTDPFEAVCKQLHALVRSLDDGGDCDDGVSERVLMDADLDGRRYLLIRLPAIERKAPSLSPREAEIVRLVAEGHPNKVIAAVLEISSWTVGTHVRRVFAKLGVSSRAAMVARTVEFGGPMEVTLAPTSAPIRMSDQLDDPGLSHPATGHSLAPNHGNTARFVRNCSPSGVAKERSRNVG